MPDLSSSPDLAIVITALLATGALAGFLAGLLGVGGGIIVIPALYYLMEALDIGGALRMHVVVGTSLAVMIPTAIISAKAHHRRSGIDFDVLRAWGWLVGLGAVLGAGLASTVQGLVLTLAYSGFVLIIAFRMFRRPTPKVYNQGLPQGLPFKAVPIFIGGLSSLIGIGGGSMNVPLLAACGYSVRKSVGTAAALGVIIAIPGAMIFVLTGLGAPGLPPLSLGYANLAGVALIAPTSLFAAPYGAHMAHKIRPDILIRIFAVFMTIAALRMIYGTFGA